MSHSTEAFFVLARPADTTCLNEDLLKRLERGFLAFRLA